MNSLSLEQLEHLDQKGWVSLELSELWLELKRHADHLEHQQQFEPAAIKTPLSLDQSQFIRNDLIHWINSDTEIKAEKKFYEQMKLFMDQIKNFFRISLDHFEMHYAIYPPNHFYQRHSDQKLENNKRHFSFVYYLNQNWSPHFGGELVGYQGHTSEIQFRLIPQGGTIIIFKSDIEHEVKKSISNRFSVTGWMRTL